MKVAKLVMVTTDNNNKFYDMIQIDDNTFNVEYGRVGYAPRHDSYPMTSWNKILHEKLHKGYSDNTSIFCVPVSTNPTSVGVISDSRVRSFIDRLIAFSKHSLEENYSVASTQVTQAQVDTAQSQIDDLVKYANLNRTNNLSSFNLTDINVLNSKLLDLFRTIPRKMKSVNDYLIPTVGDKHSLFVRFKQILSDEQSTLDVLAGQVKVNSASPQTSSESKDFLKQNGLSIKLIDSFSHMDWISSEYKDKVSAIYEVENEHTRKSFEERLSSSSNKTVKLLWHGSRSENFLSIIVNGLKIKPSNSIQTGSMFGEGIYTANSFTKSFGYTSGPNSYWARGNSKTAIIALYNVHVGKQLEVYDSVSDMNERKIKSKGDYDSLFARKGCSLRNDEFVVYNESDVDIKYVIELKF